MTKNQEKSGITENVQKPRKLKRRLGKSKIMVFERREEEVIDFNTAYRVRLPAVA